MKRDWTIILVLNAVLLGNVLLYVLLGEHDWQQTAHLATLFGIHVPIAIGALIWIERAAKRLKRRRKGLCAHCGYDLRASIDRCPECGAKIERRNASAI